MAEVLETKQMHDPILAQQASAEMFRLHQAMTAKDKEIAAAAKRQEELVTEYASLDKAYNEARKQHERAVTGNPTT